MVQWFVLMPSSKKVLGSSLTADSCLSVWHLYVIHVSVWVSSGCSGFLPQPKDIKTRDTGIVSDSFIQKYFAVYQKQPHASLFIYRQFFFFSCIFLDTLYTVV